VHIAVLHSGDEREVLDDRDVVEDESVWADPEVLERRAADVEVRPEAAELPQLAWWSGRVSPWSYVTRAAALTLGPLVTSSRTEVSSEPDAAIVTFFNEHLRN
jgi:hypothetical protein